MREERVYFVYILARQLYGTLYIGVTNDLYRRTIEHRQGRGGKFTKTQGVTKPVWFQAFGYIEDAIQREKSLKRWPRAWKINLIEQSNPDWHDLFPAMQQYAPKAPPFGASVEMGPRDMPSGPRPEAKPEDDT